MRGVEMNEIKRDSSSVDLAGQSMSLTANLADRIKQTMPMVLSVLVAVVIFLYKLIKASIDKNIDTNELATKLAINLGVLIVMRIIWVPSGRAKVEDDPSGLFYQIKHRYYLLASQVGQRGLHKDFKEFCEEYSKKEKREAITEKLNNIGLDYAVMERYKNVKSLQELLQIQDLSKKQAALIWKLKNGKGVHVKPLNNLEVLSGSPKKKGVAGQISYNSTKNEGKGMAKKMLTKVAMSIFLAFLAYERLDNYKSLEVWVEFGLMLIAIILSGWGGYLDGYADVAVNKTTAYKNRVSILEEFYTSVGVSINEVAPVIKETTLQA